MMWGQEKAFTAECAENAEFGLGVDGQLWVVTNRTKESATNYTDDTNWGVL